MLTKIDQPGVYDIPNDFYHSDCCDSPSLSHSGARTLVEECAAIYFHGSPLNPNAVAETKREFDFGTAGHLITLEPDQWSSQIVVVEGKTKDGKPSAGYASQDAKDQRAAAYAAGKTPLLPPEVEQLQEMRKVLMAHPIAGKAFKGGKAERSYFRRDPATGVWVKCRVDYAPDNLAYLVDYKTTTDVNPRAFAKRAYDMGYFSQAGWYLDTVEGATGIRPAEFWFVAQMKTAPYLVSVFKLKARAIEWGQMMNRRAIDVFARCLATNEWPGYRDPKTPDRDTAHLIDLPGYAEFQLTDRMEAGEFERLPAASARDLRRAAEFQAPLS